MMGKFVYDSSYYTVEPPLMDTLYIMDIVWVPTLHNTVAPPLTDTPYNE